jgi:hypothetical protein
MSPRKPTHGYRSRELRRRVVLPARIRHGASWSNACILNISSRGLLLHAKSPAPQGSLIELTHGNHMIVARVVWRSGAKLGLSAEDRLPIEDIATYAQTPAPPLIAADGRAVERHGQNRTYDQSRLRSRAIEYVCVVTLGASLATAAYGMVQRAFAAPLALVQAILGG